MLYYRGFTYDDICNLIHTGQAEACGYGPGVSGALNWIDNCSHATGIKLEGNKREDFINKWYQTFQNHIKRK